MIKIGDFSKLSRISIRMLRHYSEIGLLKPEYVDDFTGYRYYKAAQLTLANRIQALKEMGFSLAVISEVLKEYNDPQALKTYLLIKQQEIKEQSEELRKKLLLLDTTITRLGKDENTMTHTVIYKEMPEKYVASLRKVIPSYDQEGSLWQQLREESASQNLKISNPCISSAVFMDEGYKETNVDVEIQMTVDGKYKDTENVVFKTVKPENAACVTYKGGYENVSYACEAIANWVNDNNYDFNGPMFCIYHVSPAADKNPDNWVTEVCFPVKKK